MTTVSAPGAVYHLGPHRVLCGDANDWLHADPEDVDLMVYDPEWDRGFRWAPRLQPRTLNTLAFTDAQRFGDTVRMFGPPTWVFTWDTMAPWLVSKRRPLKQSKHCLWYGDIDDYDRDGAFWGEPPEPKDHPSTTYTPDARGRRLTDVYRASLRWVLSGAPHPHMKPADWVTCLVANTSRGNIVDPFAGSGTSMVAAHRLGRAAYMVEQHPRYVDVIRARWHGLADLAGIDPGDDALDPAVHFPGVDLRLDHDLARTATTNTPRKRHTSNRG